MNSWRKFLFVVAAVFVACQAAIYAFAVSPAYCRHTTNIADIAPCYKYDVQNMDADVLLVGDSALLYSIRPQVMTAAGAPTSYNYGMIGPAFAFDPVAVIDRYLAANRKPRAIVLYFSPWDRIERGRITDPRWFPVATLTLQHGSFDAFLRLLWARPSAIVEIPPTVVRSVTQDQSVSQGWRSAMESDGGHLDFAHLNIGGTQSLEGRCAAFTGSPPRVEVSARMRATLAAVRERYVRRNIPVLFYVAPSAECDRSIGAIRRAYVGLADNVPAALADRFFTADPTHQHTHVTEGGAITSSLMLARSLREKLPEIRAQ